MNEEISRMLAKIRSKTANHPQAVSPTLSVGQVWYPHYTDEMKEVLSNTQLLQKCRPVYINAINGHSVTVLKIKTVKSITDPRRESQVIIRDPGNVLRSVECAEITTMHISDFASDDSRYMYTLNEDVQFIITLTNAVLQGIPVTYTSEIQSRLDRYSNGLMADLPSELEGCTPRNPEQVEKFTKKYGELHPSKQPESVNDTTADEEKTIKAIQDYIISLKKSLKIADTAANFTENSDGYLNKSGDVVIITSLHKTIYNMMVENHVIDNVGYYAYRNLLVSRGLCKDSYARIITSKGNAKKVSTTIFPGTGSSK